ncbi:GSCOCG00002796001-RA-CDS, partial [Cotesia congregata]
TVGELPPAGVPASGELLDAPGQHEDDAKLPTIDDPPGVPRQETRVLLLPEVRQGLPVAQEHEEPPEGRVREGAHRVLSVLPPQDQIQAQPPEAHPQNSFLIITKVSPLKFFLLQ